MNAGHDLFYLVYMSTDHGFESQHDIIYSVVQVELKYGRKNPEEIKVDSRYR